MKYLSRINFVLLIVVIAFLVFNKYTKSYRTNVVPEISTQRLNIVGSDGNKYIVLSNPEKQALPTTNGKPVNPRQTKREVPGLLFFNQQGDEVGGLVFSIDSTESYQVLTFDQRKGDQILTLRKNEFFNNGKWKRRYGLEIIERSDKMLDSIVSEMNRIDDIKDSLARKKAFQKFANNPENLSSHRLFLGRTFSEEVGLFLKDKDENPRLKIYLDKNDEPNIEFIDKKGVKRKVKIALEN